MNNGFTIIQNAVYGSFIWQRAEYLKLWIFIIMQARSAESIVYNRGFKEILPAHTVCISVYNLGIHELTRQQARTFLKKLENAGLIQVFTKAKRTYITILDTEFYKYPNTKPGTKRKKEAERPEDQDDFNRIRSKIVVN